MFNYYSEFTFNFRTLRKMKVNVMIIWLVVREANILINCQENFISGSLNVGDTSLFNIHWSGRASHNAFSEVKNKNSEVIHVISSKNERYECHVPHTVPSKHNDDRDSYAGPNPYELIRKLIDKSNYTPCSYRLEYYWTYELCHGRYVRQYHEDRENAEKPQLQEYILGRYDKDNFDEAEKQYLEKSVPEKLVKKIEGKDFPYVLVNMTDGTICDINNKPRSANVFYVCHNEGRNDLYSFTEISTCQYEIVILTAELCKHPDFRLKTEPEYGINCYSSDESSPRRPKSLSIIELESARLRLSTKKPKLRMTGGEEIVEKDDDDEQVAPKFVFKTTIPSKIPYRPRPTSTPPIDQKIVDDFLSGKCLVGGSGWWRYRFCFKKKVEQFHAERGRPEVMILLGTWNEPKNDQWLKNNPSAKNRKLGDGGSKSKEFSTFYSNGDVCDVTQQSRQVEVRLKCKDDTTHMNYVSMSLLEPKTCQYILKVESPILCPLIKDGIATEP